MNPVELIRAKRDGKELSDKEITFFVNGAVDGSIPDYQVSAWLMAVFFKGMSFQETVALTKAMVASGRTIQFSDGKPKVDKHSTGGIGDKVSLILAPLVAACGVDVPMVAGRGLGHTGGTLDKLESIPGFSVQLSTKEFVEQIQKTSVAIMGQTKEFVPADKLFYALRDVTGTIECTPLIVASILSKKKAEGINALVLDIKVGSGAFMKTQREAERLAKLLVTVAKELGVSARALLTDMNQPLGETAGNAIEVQECLEILNGSGPKDTTFLCIELAAHMLVLGKKVSSLGAARALAKKNLTNGLALKKFEEMARSQGAKPDLFSDKKFLKISSFQREVKAKKSGVVTTIDLEKIGFLLVELGAGRKKASDSVDPTVGARFYRKIGSSVKEGTALATLYFNPERTSESQLNDIETEFCDSFQITKRHVPASKLIRKVISENGE